MTVNKNTKQNKSKSKSENKTTSMRIDSEVKENLENIQFDIQAKDRIRLSLSDTVQWLINNYERDKDKS